MEILTVTTENFETQVLQAKTGVVLDFWAPWCGYCRRINPVIQSMSEEYENLCFAKVNIDDHPKLAQKFGVNTIPTLLFFQNGQAGEEIVAPQSKADITAWLKAQHAL